MTTLPSRRRLAPAVAHILFSAVLLASVSATRAGYITYNLVDYPANETDVMTSGTDTLSGTIITDGASGLLSSSDIRGGSWTLRIPTRDHSRARYPAASSGLPFMPLQHNLSYRRATSSNYCSKAQAPRCCTRAHR